MSWNSINFIVINIPHNALVSHQFYASVYGNITSQIQLQQYFWPTQQFNSRSNTGNMKLIRHIITQHTLVDMHATCRHDSANKCARLNDGKLQTHAATLLQLLPKIDVLLKAALKVRVPLLKGTQGYVRLHRVWCHLGLSYDERWRVIDKIFEHFRTEFDVRVDTRHRGFFVGNLQFELSERLDGNSNLGIMATDSWEAKRSYVIVVICCCYKHTRQPLVSFTNCFLPIINNFYRTDWTRNKVTEIKARHFKNSARLCVAHNSNKMICGSAVQAWKGKVYCIDVTHET